MRERRGDDSSLRTGLRPGVDVRPALKRAESSVKAQETKGMRQTWNKESAHRFRGAVCQKLLEKDDSSSDGVTANMSTMLMRQMEAINKSTEKRERLREDRQEEGEGKHRKKLRAGKEEGKEEGKEGISPEGQEDHGGKAGGGSSIDSSSQH